MQNIDLGTGQSGLSISKKNQTALSGSPVPKCCLSALSILHLEDNPTDAEIVRHALLKAIPGANIKHVATREEYYAALEQGGFDIVLSDYQMPRFDGIQALAYAVKHSPEIPFIMVTGELGEDRAIETLKQGATNYVLKDNLKRLAPAIERAMELAREKQKRREAEASLRGIVEISLDGVYRRNLETEQYDYLSPAMEKVVGYSTDEMMHWDMATTLEKIHPGDLPYVQRALLQLMGGVNSTLVYRFISSDGSYRWLSDSASVIMDSRGRPLFISGIIRNITEQKLAEEKLRESEQRFHSAVNNFPDTLMIYDADGRIQFVNEFGAKWIGYPRKEILGRRDEDIFPPEITAACLPFLRQAMETKRGITRECRIPLPARVQYLIVEYIPLIDNNGNIRQLLGIIYDISVRKQTEELLRASEERYRKIVETAHEGICTIDGSYRITFANEELARMLSTSREEIIGREMFDFLPPEYYEPAKQQIARRKEGVHERYRFTLRKKDGNELTVLISASPVFDEQGAFLYSLVMFADLTNPE